MRRQTRRSHSLQTRHADPRPRQRRCLPRPGDGSDSAVVYGRWVRPQVGGERMLAGGFWEGRSRGGSESRHGTPEESGVVVNRGPNARRQHSTANNHAPFEHTRRVSCKVSRRQNRQTSTQQWVSGGQKWRRLAPDPRGLRPGPLLPISHRRRPMRQLVVREL